MRHLITKYKGVCGACGAALEAGVPAMYEKSLGIFCPGCEPTDTEEIRTYRNGARERQADKLEARAERLTAEAGHKQADFNRMRGDIAFITQPGHVPGRKKMFQRYDKGMELQNEAAKLKERVESLRQGARVAGDAEAKRQAERDRIKPLLFVGMAIKTVMYGEGKIKKINQKTVTLSSDYYSPVTVDISWVIIPEPEGRATP